MIYWLPVIFIFFEFILIGQMSKMIEYTSLSFLYKKYKDDDLWKYINLNYKDFAKSYIFFGIILLIEIIYLIVGLFHSIWFISIIVLSHDLLVLVIKQLKPTSIEKLIKRAKLEDFNSTNVKFQRYLKITQLNNNIKTHNWLLFIFPIIKIMLFASIIILHYNYNLL